LADEIGGIQGVVGRLWVNPFPKIPSWNQLIFLSKGFFLKEPVITIKSIVHGTPLGPFLVDLSTTYDEIGGVNA